MPSLDRLQKNPAFNNLEVIPINDTPYFDFTISNDSLIINEDSDPINSIYIIDIHPGGGDGLFKENDDILNFEIGDYDNDLFDDNNLPTIYTTLIYPMARTYFN